MIRLGALLALLAQTLPLAGPGAFFVCVHEDGDVQFELAAKPCCEGASSVAPAQESGDGDTGRIGVALGCDHCRDYSVTFTQVPPSGGHGIGAPARDEAFSAALPIVTFPPTLGSAFQGPANSAGPPVPRTILLYLSTVVLQV